MENASSPSFASISNPISRGRRLIFWLALFYGLFLAYLPCLQGPFLYDGLSSIVQNPDFRSASPFSAMLGDHENSLFFDRRPVGAFLTYLNFKMFGLNTYAYHLVNLCLHWLTAIIIGETMLLAARQLKLGNRAGMITLATVALWSLHPVNTMPVAYIYQRMEVLMSLFYALSIFCLLKSATNHRGRWLTLSGVSALLCLLSKESGVSVIGALFAVEWLVLKRSPLGIIRKNALFYGLLTAGIGAIIYWHLSGPRMTDLVAGSELASPWGYFQSQCSVILDYLRLMVWPKDLSFLHMPTHTENWSHWIPHLLGLLAIGAILIYLGRTRIWITLSTLLVVMILSPTSSFVPIAVEPKVEYRAYLISALVLLILVAAVWHVVYRLSEESRKAPLYFTLLMGAIIVAAFWGTRSRTAVYGNALTLWEDTAMKQPLHYKVWHNWGMANLAAGRINEAKRCAEHLVKIRDNTQDPICSYLGYQLNGLASLQGQEFKTAAASFQRALEIEDNRPETRALMAYALVKAGMTEQAKIQLSQEDLSQAITPLTLATRVLVMLAEQGKEVAQKHLQEFEKQFPQHPLLTEVRNEIQKPSDDKKTAGQTGPKKNGR